MPIYLVHGFRWQRQSIRIHVILNDLEDAAADWIVGPDTSVTILNSLYNRLDFIPPSKSPPADWKFCVPHGQIVVHDVNKQESPKPITETVNRVRRISSAVMLNGRSASNNEPKRPRTGSPSTSPNLFAETASTDKKVKFNDWSVVKFVEQYDPEDLSLISQPFAYVADHVITVGLSVDVSQEIKKYDAKSVETGDDARKTGGSKTGILSGEKSKTEADWFTKLKDTLEKDAEIGWFVVSCGDEERMDFGSDSSKTESDGADTETEASNSQTPSSTQQNETPAPNKNSLRSFFSRRKHSRTE